MDGFVIDMGRGNNAKIVPLMAARSALRLYIKSGMNPSRKISANQAAANALRRAGFTAPMPRTASGKLVEVEAMLAFLLALDGIEQ